MSILFRKSKRSNRIQSGILSLSFTIFAFCYSIEAAKTLDYKENFHRITSQDNFIIIDGQEAQLYRLFGILPFLHTFWVQIALFCATVTVICVSSWLFFKTNIANKGSTITVEEIVTSYLPEPVVRLLFYIQFEGTAFWSTLLEEIMTVIHAPLSIGLNLASKLSSKARSTFDDSGDSSYSLNPLRGTRGRRRKQNLNSASSSRSASHANGQGQHYAGLWNTGNSCFLNSTLQSITSISTVQDVLEEVIEQAEQWDVPTPVTDALYDLILQLNTPSTSRHAVIPRQLTDALSNLPQTNVGSFFYAHQQQDAHELLVLLTSAIDDEMNAIIQERNSALESNASGLKVALLPSIRPTSTNLTPFSNPFRALVAQRTACLDCGYVEAVRHYPTDELSLNVAVRPGSATTIEACLAHWSKLEVVDWICFRCSLVRTINRLKDESIYLESQAASKESNTSNGHAISISNKKKSGAKRRKAKDMKGKVDILAEILAQGYSEDEVEAKQILSLNDIKLDRTFSRAATKQVMLARTPKVLVLHLNRSSYSASSFGASKNNAAVLFDDELDLSDIVTGGDLTISGDRPISRGATPSIGESSGPDLWSVQGRKGKTSTTNGHHMETDNDGYLMNGHTYQQPRAFTKTKYRLCAIVVHYGNHSSGHYVSFRRRKATFQSGNVDGLDDLLHPWDSNGVARARDQWYRISDDSVKQCTLEDVRSQNPFLMFYERIGDDAQRLSKLKSNGHTNGSLQNGLGQTSESSETDADHQHSSLPRSHSHIPQGFEAIAQKQESALHPAPFKPRVFHRWESSPSFATEKVKVESD